MSLGGKAETVLTRDPGRRLSQVLRDLQAGDSDRISVDDIVGALRDRSFAPLMIIFAIPNVLMFVPGASFFTGLPLIFVALQLVLGRTDVWLPRFVAEQSVERASFKKIASKSIPYLERIERLAKPRWWPASYPFADRMIGAATLILATFLFLPIPFSNGLPAIAIIMLALGLSERDGYWLLGGIVLTVASTMLVAGMVTALALTVFELMLR
ncbi:exopolysaccharide biosynthesis protein [Hwanghaeella sp.]|uniref:exopolysaccharide biosynthesis protein n=1 Tax=Hwanghaeella sp. TaxID=2605943 RepID=UPI003CCB8393